MPAQLELTNAVKIQDDTFVHRAELPNGRVMRREPSSMVLDVALHTFVAEKGTSQCLRQAVMTAVAS
jgi:hypothetical protein